jgi:hypothetical protein
MTDDAEVSKPAWDDAEGSIIFTFNNAEVSRLAFDDAEVFRLSWNDAEVFTHL